MSAIELKVLAPILGLLTGATAGTSQVLAQSPGVISEHGMVLHRLGPVGAQGWGEIDVDGDGLPDLITASDGPASLLLVYGGTGGDSALRLKQAMVRRPDEISAIATIPEGDFKVALVNAQGFAELLGGWPLETQLTFDVGQSVTVAHVADVDGDSGLELLVAGEDRVGLFGLPDGNLKWSIEKAAVDIAVVDSGHTAVKKVVIAGGDGEPGFVVDGATGSVDWTWNDGFGSRLAAGRFGVDALPGFVAANDWERLSGFSLSPYAHLWTMNNLDTDAVSAADVNGDGVDEFLVGDGQWGSIRIFDSVTHQVIAETPNRRHGIWALGFVNPLLDVSGSIWYSARIEQSSDRDSEFAAAVVNPATGEERLTLKSFWQDATATLLADIDNDGAMEWIVGTSHPFSSRGLLRILDAESLQERWRAPYEHSNAFDPFQAGYRSFHRHDVGDGSSAKLVAAGKASTSGLRVLVLDGESHEVQTQLPSPPEVIYDDMVASRLIRRSPGGNDELLVLSQSITIGLPNVRLKTYALPGGGLTWEGPILGDSFDRSRALDVGQLDDDMALEYVVVYTSGAVVIDSLSSEIDWDISGDFVDAVALRDPVGTLLLAERGGRVGMYSVDTPGIVSSFELPAPIERLERVPGRDDLLLAVAGERLHLIRPSGSVVAQSSWIGDGPDIGDNLDVIPSGDGWRVSIGRSFASYLFDVEYPENLFRSDFESERASALPALPH